MPRVPDEPPRSEEVMTSNGKKRYMFIGDFDLLLMSLFRNRGHVIQVNSAEDALNQSGGFTLIVIDHKLSNRDVLSALSRNYPENPIVVSTDGEGERDYDSVRYVKFDDVVDSQISWEERLAETEIRVRELRDVHHEAKKLLILVHNQPDPDCISSAMALRTLLKRNKRTATIGYFGEKISRPENIAMVELMDIDIKVISEEEIRTFDSIALVDVQPSYFAGTIAEVDSVIDHHPNPIECYAKFTEISSEEGATATIMTRFLRAAQVDISEKLSTALLYGIKTDTITLNRGADLDDLEAFTYLYNRADLGLLRKIESKNIYSEEIKCYGEALKGHWIENDIIFMDLGRIEKEHLISQLADMGIRVEGVQWAVAFGIVSNSHLVISVRNLGFMKSAGRLLFELFDEIGSAGGHRSYAKAVIPLKEVKTLIGESSQKGIDHWLTKVFKNATGQGLENGR